MVGTETHGSLAAVGDRSQQVLALVHGFLQSDPKAPWTVEELLRELLAAYGAAGAGMALPWPGPAVIRYEVGRQPATAACWEEDVLLAEKTRRAATVDIEDTDGHDWMLAAGCLPEGCGSLIWVLAEPGRVWSPAERACLPLAGQALGRLLALREDGLRQAVDKIALRRHVENAVAVTGRLAHDFGNVLTGILGFTELSLNQLPPESLLRRYLSEVYQSAQQGAQWVHKLQLFARKPAPEVRPARLELVATEEENRVRPHWEGQVTLLKALPEDLPPLAIDIESLRHALAQLLDNAREAIVDKGVVTLSARRTHLSATDCSELLGYARPGPHVEITVTDTGAGLPPETQRRMFAEMFFSTKKRHRGLGMAVVYGILHAFHGGLRFGPDPEVGTAVRLFLPVAHEAAPPRTSADALRPRILLVDDDRVVLRAVSRILEAAGYRVDSAPGPAEACQRFAETDEPYGLLVTDVVMPEMDGFRLARRLTAQDPRLQVVFISGQPLPGEAAHDELVRRSLYLRKPCDPQTLLQAVGQTLANKV